MMINLTSNLEKSLESELSILDGQGEQSIKSFTELLTITDHPQAGQAGVSANLPQPLPTSLPADVMALGTRGAVHNTAAPLGEIYSATTNTPSAFNAAELTHHSQVAGVINKALLANPSDKQLADTPKSSMTTASTALVTSQPIATTAESRTMLTSPLNANNLIANQELTNLPMKVEVPSNSAMVEQLINGSAVKPLQTPQSVSQWGPVTIATAAPQLQQAQQLLTPLREQLRFQIDQQIKTAELRLDPPSLGKVELNIRLDGDRLHIQMHAANAAVRDSLLMGLDRLRSELANDHGGQVNVDISHGESHSEQQQTEPHSIASSSLIDTASTTETTEQSTSNQVDLRA